MKSSARRTGQIIKRGNERHLVRVYIGCDPITGKRKYRSQIVKGTKKEAQALLNGFLREMDLGTFVEPATTTLGEYLDKWLQTAAKPAVSERTYADYCAWLTRYVREPLGNQKLSSLKPLAIQKLYADMQERGLSSRTVRYTHAILSSALKQAVRWGMLSRNPCELVRLPNAKPKNLI